MPDINWLAAIVAGVLGFLPGTLWYSDLMFQRAWKADAGVVAPPPNMGVRIGTGLALSLVAALVFAWSLGPRPPLETALLAGLAVGAGFIATALGIQYLFEGKTVRLALINGGYHTVQFLIFGLVLGLWN